MHLGNRFLILIVTKQVYSLTVCLFIAGMEMKNYIFTNQRGEELEKHP